MLGLPAESTSDVTAAARECQCQRVEHSLQVAVRRGLRDHPRFTGRRNLPGGQAVRLVIHDDVGEVNIAPHGLDEVVQANAVAVTVTAGDDHGHVVIGKLGSGGKREGSAV